jgi:phage terminase large subunit GpA-like protein
MDLRQSLSEGIKPDPLINFAEWAETKFILPPGAVPPGLINLDFVPYLIEPLVNFSWSSPITEEYWMKGIQIAASTLFEIIIQATVDCFQCPIIAYYPSDSMAIEYVKTRIEPAFENNPIFKGKISDGYDRKGKSTHGLKIFPGGSIKFIGGISEKAYRTYSASMVFFDDIDSLPRNIAGTKNKNGENKGQGSPITLGRGRTNAKQGKYKMGVSGSPTDEETSIIYEQYRTYDQRKYNVVCPFCGQLQIIDFWRIRPPKKTGLSGYHLECDACNKLIPENKKFWMMQIKNGAKWIPTKESNNSLIVSRHISSAYSLLGYTWERMFDEFTKANDAKKRGKIDLMIAFWNTKLGLPWADKIDNSLDHRLLLKSKEDYNKIPEEAAILTAAVDVQGNRLEVLVVGHCENSHIYCIEHKIIGGSAFINYGLPGSPYNDLVKYLNIKYVNYAGHEQPILQVVIDMGFNSIIVSPFLRDIDELDIEWNIAGIFGGSGTSKKKTFVSDPIKNKYGVEQHEINVDEGKTIIYNKLKNIDYDGKPKEKEIHFSFHPSFTDEFMRQLTAEVFNKKTRKWDTPSGRRNEALDLLNYNLAAFDIYTNGGNVDWADFKKWNKTGCMKQPLSGGPRIISEGAKL